MKGGAGDLRQCIFAIMQKRGDKIAELLKPTESKQSLFETNNLQEKNRKSKSGIANALVEGKNLNESEVEEAKNDGKLCLERKKYYIRRFLGLKEDEEVTTEVAKAFSDVNNEIKKYTTLVDFDKYG